ncbi:MAG TPA: NADPH:quinone oxidoreductase family protein [Ktedonobacterales bacterium]|jgi:NADPH2:quinone reductase|nr:NADPH:quinone oxidoreductase family protein [Ktedonobacterales bacterium]
MKAVLCRAYGPPDQLEIAEVATPEPKAGEIVIGVRACAVNFPDTLIIQGKYQFQPPLPFTPGTDVAGVVQALGAGVEGLAVGDRVATLVMHGGYAEAVICDARTATRIPDGVDFVMAAAFQMAYGTSYHALVDRGRLQTGETLLVLGASGGVGLAAVELGKLLGARVIAAASSAAKLEVCRQRGADEVIDYGSEDLRERLKALAPRGVDVVYDPVGGALAEPALRGVGWRGRYLVVGFAAGDIPRIPLNLPLLKGCSVVGVFYGGFIQHEPERSQANTRQLLNWIAEGKITPLVSRTYPLEHAADALKDVMARRATGKLVLVMGE